MRKRIVIPSIGVWLIALSSALALSFGCAGSRGPGDGSLGSKLFYSRCRSCHVPVDPASKAVDFWRSYLGRYAERAYLMPAERDSVMAFLVRAATAPTRGR